MRRLILMLLVAAGLIVLHQSSASAADFTVNSNGDGADAVPGNGVCATAGGTCTLRAAVTESEALTGSDTITVPAMTISLGSPLTITKTTTIRGAGPRATIVTGTFGHILLSIGGGDVVVRDLALQGASANGGGGLAVQQVGNAASKLIDVRIANNTITGAVGTAYGPVYLIAGEMEILRSSITGNSTTTAGQASGGGIYVAGASTRLLVENSTIHANSVVSTSSSGSFGGGIMTIANSVTTIRSSTITSNIAGNTVSLAGQGGNFHRQAPLSVENSIVADGAAALGITANCSGSVDFSGRNIVSDTTCGAANASRSITNPLLGPLVTTTSGTDFRMPALTSPALDAAVGCTLAVDQREQVRPIGSACDLGAVEVGADVSVSQTVSNPAPAAGADVVFTVVAKNAGQDDAADTTLAVNLPGSAAITSVSSSQGSCSTTGLSVNCAFGTLDREGEVTVLVVARAPGSGTMTSTATVTAPIIDPNSANNSATATATVPGVSSPPPPPSPAPIAAACSNSIPGDNKGNKLRGTSAGDRIRGVGGNDVLRGLGGDDCLNGGRGNDRLIAGPGSDRLTGGKGRDIMLGAGGPDMIKARDGQRDVIKCGPGKDKVVADRSDRVAKDCEQVRRK